MRRFGDLILFALQWLLMLWGIALLVLARVEYDLQSDLQQGLAVTGFESAITPTPLRLQLVQAVTTGLIAMGLSVMLFYLRRLYFSRRQ